MQKAWAGICAPSLCVHTCVREAGVASTPAHRVLYSSALLRSSCTLQISPHSHRSAPVTPVQKPPHHQHLPPNQGAKCSLTATRLHAWTVSLFCCFNSQDLCGGNHSFGREKRESEEVTKRERHERTGRGEEAGEGKESSGACRLEIIGVRISGQSVIFSWCRAAACSGSYSSAHSHQYYRSSAFHLRRTGGSWILSVTFLM